MAQNLDDEFMKKGILLIVDGTEPELVRGILETELMNMDERHRSVAGFFETWAALGPAWGMIGTLIGLVNIKGFAGFISNWTIDGNSPSYNTLWFVDS